MASEISNLPSNCRGCGCDMKARMHYHRKTADGVHVHECRDCHLKALDPALAMAGRYATSTAPGAVASRTRYRATRRRKRCVWCSRPSRGSCLCHGCAHKSKTHQAILAAERIAAGLCRECGWPRSDGTRCMTCRLKRKSRPSRQQEYRMKNEYKRAA